MRTKKTDIIMSCLICGSNPVSNHINRKQFIVPEENHFVQNEISTIFIVQNILQIPSSICVQLLCKSGHPSEWGLQFCSLCERIINESYFIFTRIQNLVKEYDLLVKGLRAVINDGNLSKEGKVTSTSSLQMESATTVIGTYLQSRIGAKVATSISGEISKNNAEHVSVSPPISDLQGPEIVQNEIEHIGTLTIKEEISEELLGNWDTESNPNFGNEEDDIILNSYTIDKNVERRRLRQRSPLRFEDQDEMEIDYDPKVGIDPDWNNYSDPEISETDINDKEIAEQDSFIKKSQTNTLARFKKRRNKGLGLGRIRDYKKEYELRKKQPRKGLYQCQYCSFSGTTSLITEAHVMRMHGGVNNPYKCTFCPLSFQKLARVLCHIDQKHHSEIRNDNTEGRHANNIKDLFSSIFTEEEEEEEAGPPQNESILNCKSQQSSIIKPNSTVRRRKAPPGKELACEHCNFHFSTGWLLDAHILRCHHDDKSPFQCDICDKRFQRKALMFQHRSESHSEIKTDYDGPSSSREARISQLAKKSKRKSVKIPKILHTPKKLYHCKICNIKLGSKIESEIHVKVVHEGPDKKRKCDICNLQFLTEPGLKLHVDKDHTISEKNPEQAPSLDCEECDKHFKNRNALDAHLRLHHGKAKEHLCELCSQVFAEAIYLTAHQRQVHHTQLNLSPIKCGYCDKVLYSKRSLIAHEVAAHTKNFPFTCTDCGRGFTDNLGLTKHRNAVHLKLKAHQCETCGKGFAQRISLTVHRRIHTGEKPYKCKFCDKCFSDKPTFNRHVETHGDKTHICTDCGKEFKVWHAFRLHCKNHGVEKMGMGQGESEEISGEDSNASSFNGSLTLDALNG